ncbi:hypothetical protein [Paenibacillus sp. JCM 10914]|nr:hypothetical protein [Paenibacillus sp. JCM 10914]
MSTNIFLVRHAIKEKRKGDVSITAEGSYKRRPRPDISPSL